jgi:hypothetical protein
MKNPDLKDSGFAFNGVFFPDAQALFSFVPEVLRADGAGVTFFSRVAPDDDDDHARCTM